MQDPSYTQKKNLWDVPSLLLQKLPAEKFVVTTKLDTSHLQAGDSTGLIMYGFDYQWIGVKASQQGQQLVLVRCEKNEANCQEQTLATVDLPQKTLSLRMSVGAAAKTQFAYSLDAKTFTPVGDLFTASKGRWVGAQMGLFSLGESSTSFVDVDYFRATAE